MKDKNPYANSDGSPIEGKEPDFFEWSRKQELKRRESLPAEDKKRLHKADLHLADKMNS